MNAIDTSTARTFAKVNSIHPYNPLFSAFAPLCFPVGQIVTTENSVLISVVVVVDSCAVAVGVGVVWPADRTVSSQNIYPTLHHNHDPTQIQIPKAKNPLTSHHQHNSNSPLQPTPTFATMPVPLPSTTDKSTSATSTSATAQTAHHVEKPSTQSVASATHTEKSAQELEAERPYEERMEEEYAKREGGA
ncbi:hypothetical protein CC80DRAFT_548991 [Byssothecium circinans]|uniref:Uncharacterized protein n=1 Tax=Byssothecium circinans TaxID=147558 RepID=A0A6A5TV68_9PLEO|nr:hypothetical protein CC80DRAFT_548991 [Byssothecium circinans]